MHPVAHVGKFHGVPTWGAPQRVGRLIRLMIAATHALGHE
jgi:hypothetical protein